MTNVQLSSEGSLQIWTSACSVANPAMSKILTRPERSSSISAWLTGSKGSLRMDTWLGNCILFHGAPPGMLPMCGIVLTCSHAPVMCRQMREWHIKRKDHANPDHHAGLHPDERPMQDHFDGKLWEKFCQDPEILANGGPSYNAALEFCADGVSPYKKTQHSMWLAAMSALNLPPFLRHTLETMHLCFIIPGPKEPVSSPLWLCPLHIFVYASAAALLT